MGVRCCNDYLFMDKDSAKVLFKNAGHYLVNTPTRWYNCGAFALGYDYWYLPYGDEEGDELYQLEEACDKGWIDTHNEFVNGRARVMIDYMIRYENCRQIYNENQLDADEYLVLFKASYDDFHYARAVWITEIGIIKWAVMIFRK